MTEERNRNPYIEDDPIFTVSRVHQSLSLFRIVLDTKNPETIELDFDERSGLLCVLDGLDEALVDSVIKLDDYEPKGECPTDETSD